MESQKEAISPKFSEAEVEIDFNSNFDRDDKTDDPKVEVKSDIYQPTKGNLSDGNPKPVPRKIKTKPIVERQSKYSFRNDPVIKTSLRQRRKVKKSEYNSFKI